MQAFLASNGGIVGEDEHFDGGSTVNDMAAHPPEPAGPATQTPPSEAPPEMITPEAAQATVASMSQLKRGITEHRMAGVSRNGPTLDDLVREEIRPILKQWIDAHLPPMVERLVRAELERLSAQA